MLCACGHKTGVNATRALDDGGVWRERACKGCGLVFTTVEQPVATLPRTGALRAVVNPVYRQRKVPVQLPKQKNAPRSTVQATARRRIEDMKARRELEQDE